MSKSSIYGIQREFQHNLNLVYDIDRNLKDLKNDLLSANALFVFIKHNPF